LNGLMIASIFFIGSRPSFSKVSGPLKALLQGLADP
jgi:hypothetical protein